MFHCRKIRFIGRSYLRWTYIHQRLKKSAFCKNLSHRKSILYNSKTVKYFNGHFCSPTQWLSSCQQTRSFLSSITLFSDIPDYVKEIASIVPENEAYIMEDAEVLGNSMEEFIIESFLTRALPYEEIEGSFMVSCPTCSHTDSSREAFVHKNTGYSVCPWCYWDGPFEDFVKLLDVNENSLTKEQLENYFSSTVPIEECHGDLLSASPLKNINLSLLRNANGCLSEDESKIVFPLLNEVNERMGFASLSLLQEETVVKRFVKSSCTVFRGLPLPKSKKKLKRVVVVSSPLDALHLARFKIHSVVICLDSNKEDLEWIFGNFKAVVLCSAYDHLPSNLLKLLAKNENVECFTVRLTKDVPTISSLSEARIMKLLSEAMPIFSSPIVRLRDLEDLVYSRIVNRDVMYGIQWSRYTELNDLLMGHRQGELTVFSGLTGTGKTTFMSEYSLDLCMNGVCTLWGSFEVSVDRLCEIMLQQFCGHALSDDLVEFKRVTGDFSQLPMRFLNLHGQQPLQEILDAITEAVLLYGVRHVIIDNLQFMLGVHGASVDWWLGQDRAVGAFRQFASAYGCHVTLIVHPRKLIPGERLNLHSISGGARVTQEADNVMILHSKENRDGSTNALGPKTLQVVKNRYGGTLGETRLRFHKESLTLSGHFHGKKMSGSDGSRIPSIDGASEAETTNYDVKGLPFFHH